MSEKKLQCAFCKAILFDDDDVVYCPDCGAPHHRECYKSLGHCARIEYHGKDEPAELEQKEKSDLDREGKTCPACGKMSSSDTLFCPYCGNRFIEPEEQEAQPEPPPEHDPYSGVSPEEELDGVSATELASYVRLNTRRYLPLFKSFAGNKRKVGWNWAGFLFGPSWLFFRKCGIQGISAMLFSVIGYLMMCPLTSKYYTAVMGVLGGMTEEQIEQITNIEPYADIIMADFMKAVDVSSLLLFLLGGVVLLLINVVVGMFGDRIYFNHCVEKVKKIHMNEGIDNKLQAIMLMGGVNIFTGALSYYALSFIFQVLLSLFLS